MCNKHPLNFEYLSDSLSGCDGMGSWSSCCSNPDTWACCTSSNQCGVGEGDCDVDNDCLGDLLCGSDNCRTAFGGNFDVPEGRLENKF